MIQFTIYKIDQRSGDHIQRKGQANERARTGEKSLIFIIITSNKHNNITIAISKHPTETEAQV